LISKKKIFFYIENNFCFRHVLWYDYIHLNNFSLHIYSWLFLDILFFILFLKFIHVELMRMKVSFVNRMIIINYSSSLLHCMFFSTHLIILFYYSWYNNFVPEEFLIFKILMNQGMHNWQQLSSLVSIGMIIIIIHFKNKKNWIFMHQCLTMYSSTTEIIMLMMRKQFLCIEYLFKKQLYVFLNHLKQWLSYREQCIE
jgi:hypothetical protein